MTRAKPKLAAVPPTAPRKPDPFNPISVLWTCITALEATDADQTIISVLLDVHEQLDYAAKIKASGEPQS